MSLRFRGAGGIEPAYSTAELQRDSLVEFIAGDVACKVQFVVADRRRSVAMYDVLLANKRDVNVCCRLYVLDHFQRASDIAVFDVGGNSQGRSRFTVPFGRREAAQRVYIEISGDAIAMLFETRLPRPKAAFPIRAVVAVVAGLCLVAALLWYQSHVWHAIKPATAAALRPPASHALAAREPHGPQAVPPYLAIDDAAADGADTFVYSGAWQHLENMHDGRSRGTSSRSFHTGDTASFDFVGERFKVFGVKGPGGGFAQLSIDGRPSALLYFYAPRKATGMEVYASPVLPSGPHAVDIVVVSGPHDPNKRRYVNIDGAAYAVR